MEMELEPVALTPQKQDSAWKHCEVYRYRDRLQMRCLYCRKMFKGGGITRVKEHLAGKKGQGPICDRVPEDVRQFLQQCLDGTVRRQRKRRKWSSEPQPIAYFPPSEVDDALVVNNGFKSPGPAVRKNGFDNNASANVDGDTDNNLIPVAISCVKNVVQKESSKTLHMAIGRFLFDIGADSDSVNSVNLQPMIDAVVSGGFGASIPGNRDLRGWILKNCVEEMMKEIDESRLLWKRMGCSVLVEQLDSGKGRKVLNFLVYCPEKVMFLKSVDASEIIPSADKLYELFREVVEEVGETHVIQVITKCEDHYAAAGKMLMDAYPSLYWVPCAAHCVDKMFEDFGKVEWIREAIKQAQSITRFIYNHSGVLNLMWGFTSGNDIVQPALSRSATDFMTLGRIADLKPNLQDMVTSPEWNDCLYSKGTGGLAMTDTINDEAFWKALTLLSQLTDPLLRVQRIACSEKSPAMGYVYAAIYRAKESIKKLLVKREDYLNYWKVVDSRWEEQKLLPLHAAGFFLNPNFFYNANEELRGEILSAVFDCIERLVPDVAIQDKIIKEINLYKNSVGIFGRNLAIRARGTMLPGEWWSTYGESCLNLSRFAIRILSQTCSSSIQWRRNVIPIEQIYQSKNCIEQQRLSDLVFVQYNMRLKRRDQESRDFSVDPLSDSICMDVLEGWVSKNQTCIEENGSSDWKLLEFGKRTQVPIVVDEAENLGTGFDDSEIFEEEKEVEEEGYYTNISDKIFT
ncbi:PREDICTED: uncharacterized protein LOC104803010 [Tarenaya hassleriana]|uniref:uncharacterized protein LOC104803010 n=1 Tax=Tarenaya hassleriana TaxID=28532 RepID=UPI00053C5F6E|nr:PREDICTED: uncharacterized protein LOC104803010 [Tarenaya hassleriana]XP_010525165.1 PREDICTED: uncharacterized protein LOC104803010 [Tarenaya hassleriana]XP_010525166.1 PREDICTED: uncharacterized protein LOC104803010 [Tarenaya hassleriana]XP_010525167.1 PREDICTED: uncharacterized protein LOC104803010 [Tarenaya hassleriana]XP_010525168.1 PREDICTED: uncharacterized protein LOC104803010 [Tarenaya hassleriana]